MRTRSGLPSVGEGPRESACTTTAFPSNIAPPIAPFARATGDSNRPLSQLAACARRAMDVLCTAGAAQETALTPNIALGRTCKDICQDYAQVVRRRKPAAAPEVMPKHAANEMPRRLARVANKDSNNYRRIASRRTGNARRRLAGAFLEQFPGAGGSRIPPNLVGAGPNSGQSWSNSGLGAGRSPLGLPESCPVRRDSGRSWPSFHRCWPDLFNFWPMSTRLGRC